MSTQYLKEPTLLALITLHTLLILISACSSTPSPTANNQTTASEKRVGSCSLELPASASDEEAIGALIAAESTYMVSQEMAPLMRLWAQDAHITDARHTPDQSEDDHTWRGADVIRHRYVSIIFPSAPSAAQPADLSITIDGERAEVKSTTQIDQEVSLAGDQWEVVKKDGCWLLQSLTFNLEAS